jgi:hypothetical protein
MDKRTPSNAALMASGRIKLGAIQSIAEFLLRLLATPVVLA